MQTAYCLSIYNDNDDDDDDDYEAGMQNNLCSGSNGLSDDEEESC